MLYFFSFENFILIPLYRSVNTNVHVVKTKIHFFLFILIWLAGIFSIFLSRSTLALIFLAQPNIFQRFIIHFTVHRHQKSIKQNKKKCNILKHDRRWTVAGLFHLCWFFALSLSVSNAFISFFYPFFLSTCVHIIFLFLLSLLSSFLLYP